MRNIPAAPLLLTIVQALLIVPSAMVPETLTMLGSKVSSRSAPSMPSATSMLTSMDADAFVPGICVVAGTLTVAACAAAVQAAHALNAIRPTSAPVTPRESRRIGNDEYIDVLMSVVQ